MQQSPVCCETAASSESASVWDLSLIRASGVFVFILLAGQGADYLGNLLFGRWLGHEAYGDFGVGVSLVLLFANFANLGTDESVPRFLPAYLSENRHGHVMGFLRGHLLAIVCLTLFLCLTGFGVLHFFKGASLEHQAAGIWWILPFLGVANFCYYILSSRDRSMAPANLLQSVAAPLAMVGAGWLLLNRHGDLAEGRAVTAYGLSVLALLPAYGFLLLRSLPREVWRSRPVYDFGRWTRTALPMIFTTIVYYTLEQAVIYVMEHVGDESHVGILLACLKTSDLVFLSFTAVSLILSSRIAPLAEAGRTEELGRLIRGCVRLTLLVSALAAGAVVLFGRFFLGMFGPGFSEGYPALLILAGANMVIGTLSISWPLLSYSGHERAPIPGLVLALVAMVALAELTIPRYGLVAAAACKSLVMLLLFVWMALQVRRRMGIRIWAIA